MRRLLVASLLVPLLVRPAAAQTQAANGSIEGTVSDVTGGVLPGVTVVVTNTDVGAERLTVTNEHGLYRAVLLPLGTYRITAELPGFKKFEQVGIQLSAGQTVVVNARLNVGEVSETVSVSADTQPLLDSARIDAGRNLTAVEVRNLPLVSRNPFNFALVQPGITGFENAEFGVPRLAANGTLMRINYQIDGNTNTEKDRAGLRLLPMSEVMVSEVKVVTAGYAPEFGQTMGLVYNAITPSGTNRTRGDASYLFRRKSFSAFPFYFRGPRTDATRPDTRVDTATATLGGPIVPNRLLYYLGYERTARDLSAQRVVTISPAEAQALGLPAQPATIPARQAATFFIGRADYQLSSAHRLALRSIVFRNDSPHNGSPGGRNSLQRGTDFLDAMSSTSAQVVTTLGSRQMNEFRTQYARRSQSSFRNADSGTGPAIDVLGIRFGSPLFAAGQDNDGFSFRQGIFQVINNYTLLRSSHSYKVGVDAQWVRDERTSAPVELYTFPSIPAYQAAASGANRFSYSQFTQLLGERSFRMRTSLLSLFAQDDWQLTPSVKVLYGIRYDQYRLPQARRDSPFTYSQRFSTDRDNWGPRGGVAWRIGERTVLRASTGIMFDQPILAIYENALQLNGSPLARSVNLGPASAGAPAYPGNLSSVPPGVAFPTPSIVTVDPEFETAKAWQSHLQVERSFATDYTITVGYVFARQTALPVVTDINVINPLRSLADGRPVFDPAVNAGTRMDPRFDHIYTVQSIGDGRYHAVSATLARRFARGLTMNLSYTFGDGRDNAPLNNAVPGGVGLSVNGDDPRSDPTSLDRDEGPNLLDVRHSFNGSIVFSPEVRSGRRFVDALGGNNQVGVLMQFNSGLPFNIRGGTDLNRDGQANNDRPLFVGRNSMYLPARYNVDVRYSRFVPLGPVRGEIIGELKNLFNTVQTAAVSSVVAVDTAGNAVSPLPDDPLGFGATSGYEQRQFQLGFRVRF
jgi:hypothetical protein